MKIQVHFDPEGTRMFERLKYWTGSKSHKELINNALTLLHWAAAQYTQGRIVASVDERHENYKELVMPALQHAASLAQSGAVDEPRPAPATQTR